MDFLNKYDDWSNLLIKEKKAIVEEVVAFYEKKTLEYITSRLKKSPVVNKDPVLVEYVKEGRYKVDFGNNVVYVPSPMLKGDKKDLFFPLCQCTICAVFLNLFLNTASNPNKKTNFTTLANSFALSITSEFAPTLSFEQDMMESFALELGEALGVELD